MVPVGQRDENIHVCERVRPSDPANAPDHSVARIKALNCASQTWFFGAQAIGFSASHTTRFSASQPTGPRDDWTPSAPPRTPTDARGRRNIQLQHHPRFPLLVRGPVRGSPFLCQVYIPRADLLCSCHSCAAPSCCAAKTTRWIPPVLTTNISLLQLSSTGYAVAPMCWNAFRCRHAT